MPPFPRPRVRCDPQLLELARTAKISEAAVLRAAYERRESRQKELAKNGPGAIGGKELWRLPPPPRENANIGAIDNIKNIKGGDGRFDEGNGVGGAADICGGRGDWTAEDRLLLAGLRSKPRVDGDESSGADCIARTGRWV